jgi:hypothetical protein
MTNASPALSFFKLIEVGTNFLFANSVSEFPRSQDPKPKSTVAVMSQYIEGRNIFSDALGMALLSHIFYHHQ